LKIEEEKKNLTNHPVHNGNTRTKYKLWFTTVQTQFWYNPRYDY